MDRNNVILNQKVILKKIYKFTFCLFIVLYQFNSSAESLNLQLSSVETRRLQYAINRDSNNRIYLSNLEKIVHPLESELYQEARLTNSKYLSDHYDILSNYYTKKLSENQMQQLSSQCSTILASYKSNFPLTETTLACAGWWLDMQNVKRDKSQDHSKKRIKPFSLSLKDKYNLYNYRKLSLYSSLYNMKTTNFSDVEKLAQTALKTKYPCSYKNAVLALVSTLEDFLPQKEAYEYIKKIHKKTHSCFKPNQRLTERFNSRLGIIHLINGDYKTAKQAFNRNLMEKNPQDESRTLFWLGTIEKNYEHRKTTKYWTRLRQTNPIGFFALVANLKSNIDPQDDFIADKEVTLQNRISGGWKEVNLQAFLFDLFYAKQNQEAMEALSKQVAKSKFSHRSLYLFWAVSHNIAHNPRYSITSLAMYFSTQKKPRYSKTLLRINFPLYFSKEILRRSKKVDPLLVLSLIRQESAFDQFAQSHANAFGLMQILPSTARKINKDANEKKLFHAQTNIDLGVSYLEELYERFNGCTEFVLAAYNAGPNKVEEWAKRVPIKDDPFYFMEYVPYKETQNYVSTIMRNYFWYKKLATMSGDEQSQQFLEKNISSIWKPNYIVVNMK